jgi:hypothetical protein
MARRGHSGGDGVGVAVLDTSDEAKLWMIVVAGTVDFTGFIAEERSPAVVSFFF